MRNDKNTRVLVVASHPDDEVLGCGGTIAHHAENGATVEVVFLTKGVAARIGNEGDILSLQDQRLGMAREAAKILGAKAPIFLDFPDQGLDTCALLDITQKLEQVVRELTPDIIYTHHGGDLNLDHRLAHQAVLTACRPLPQTSVKAIYSFETVSSTEWASNEMGGAFTPNRFVDITHQLDRKLEALGAYDIELREFPHARSLESVKALACHRGVSVGVHAAEAFMVVREIIS